MRNPSIESKNTVVSGRVISCSKVDLNLRKIILSKPNASNVK